MRISSITKNAGKACNNRLYRHIRTFEKIVKNYFVIYIKTGNKQEYSFIVKIMVVLSLLLVIYDEVLKTEGAFLVYFMLSLGLVSIEKKDELV